MISLFVLTAALSNAEPNVTDAELEKQASSCGMSTQIQWRGGSKTPDVKLDRKHGQLRLRIWQGNDEGRDCMQKWGETRGLTVIHWQD